MLLIADNIPQVGSYARLEIKHEEGIKESHHQCQCQKRLQDYHGARGAVGTEVTRQPSVSDSLLTANTCTVTNMLSYGVSRVNGQQWDYLLTDAQAAQNLMRAMVRTAHSEQRDPNAGRIRQVLRAPA